MFPEILVKNLESRQDAEHFNKSLWSCREGVSLPLYSFPFTGILNSAHIPALQPRLVLRGREQQVLPLRPRR